MTDTDRQRHTSLRTARVLLSEFHERQEAERARRAALPASVCRVCGDRVPAGEGDRAIEPAFTTVRDRAEHTHRLASIPAEVDAWRRRCQPCVDAAGRGEAEAEAISGILGRPVRQSDAFEVVGALKRWTFDPVNGDMRGIALQLPLAEVVGRWTGQTWGHVTDDERQLVTDALAQVRSQRRPRRCRAGGCGLCGRSHSLRWTASRLHWADGTAAPVCDDCRPIYAMRSQPAEGDDVHRVIVELVTGHTISLGYRAPEGIRAYCEERDRDPRGTAEPWEYAAEAIADLRFQTWRRQPGLAPAEYAEAAHGWNADWVAEITADRERERAQNAAHATGW